MTNSPLPYLLALALVACQGPPPVGRDLDLSLDGPSLPQEDSTPSDLPHRDLIETPSDLLRDLKEPPQDLPRDLTLSPDLPWDAASAIPDQGAADLWSDRHQDASAQDRAAPPEDLPQDQASPADLPCGHCPPGQVCFPPNGRCMAPCQEGGCARGLTCRADGSCAPISTPCDDTMPCPGLTACGEGICREIVPCASSRECLPGRACDALTHICRDWPALCANDSQCPPSWRCHGRGHCYPLGGCLTDLDCPGGPGDQPGQGDLCQLPPGRCVACLSDPDCPGPLTCQDNPQANNRLCAEIDPCSTDQDCRQGRECSPEGTCTPQYCQDDTLEGPHPDQQNDTPDQATQLHDLLYPNLALCADEDWYTVTVPEELFARVELVYDTLAGGLGLELIDTLSGERSDTSTGLGYEVAALGPAPWARTLWVGVRPLGLPTTQPYALSLTLAGAEACLEEPSDLWAEDNDPSLAREIQPPGILDQTLCAHDEDWFSITLGQGENVRLRALFEGPAFSLELRATDERGRPLANSRHLEGETMLDLGTGPGRALLQVTPGTLWREPSLAYRLVVTSMDWAQACEATPTLEVEVGETTWRGDTSSAVSRFASLCGQGLAGLGPEALVHLRVMEAPVYLEVTVQGQGALEGNTILSLLGDCQDLTSEGECGNALVHALIQEAGTWTVVVDGWSQEHQGPYDLLVRAEALPPPPTNDGCLTPQAVEVGLEPLVIEGSTRSATDQARCIRPECGAGCTNPDVVFALHLLELMDVTLRVTAEASNDVVLFLRKECADPLSQIACNDMETPSALNVAALSLVRASADTMLYAFVDGHGTSSGNGGPFTLEILPSTPTPLATHDLCEDAEGIMVEAGTTSLQSSTFLASDDGSGTCGGRGEADVHYALTLEEALSLKISLTPGSVPDLLSLRPACGAAEVVCGRSLALAELAAGVWYLTVDGLAGAFGLEILAGPPKVVPDTCAMAFPLALGPLVPDVQLSDDTSFANHSPPSPRCAAAYEAQDLVYRIDLAEAGDLGVEVDGAYDAVVELRAICEDVTSSLWCADEPQPLRTILRGLEAGSTYLWVDGYGRSQGPFDIHLAYNPACLVHGDCPPDQLCQGLRCMPRDCIWTADCPGAEACEGGLCVAPSGQAFGADQPLPAPLADGDPDGMALTIGVDRAGPVAALTLAVDLPHPRTTDLRVTLAPPSLNTPEVVLHDGGQGDRDGLHGLYHAGHPGVGDITTLWGTEAQGAWTVTVSDMVAGQVGQVAGVRMWVEVGEP